MSSDNPPEGYQTFIRKKKKRGTKNCQHCDQEFSDNFNATRHEKICKNNRNSNDVHDNRFAPLNLFMERK